MTTATSKKGGVISSHRHLYHHCHDDDGNTDDGGGVVFSFSALVSDERDGFPGRWGTPGTTWGTPGTTQCHLPYDDHYHQLQHSTSNNHQLITSGELGHCSSLIQGFVFVF